MSQAHGIFAVDSMHELPSWVVSRAPSTAFFGNGRLKITLIAIACMVLGYLVTSSFRPIDDVDAFAFQPDYDLASTGILEGPSVYPGAHQSLGGSSGSQVGNSKSKIPDDQSASRPVRKPSIKGALSDLHHAVSDKVVWWKPWNSDLQPGFDATPGFDTTGAQTINLTSPPLKSEELIYSGSDNLGHKTRVGKCTIVLYGSSIYERTVQTHAMHDRIHGYPMNVLRQTIMDDVWSKPAYILSLLLRELAKPQEERLEWLLWVDADTIMLNPYIPVESFLPPSPQFDDIHLLVTHDWNGLNNGVFPVRVCQWSVELFSAIVSFRHYKSDTVLTFRDQSAMDMLLQEKKFAAHTVEAPQRWFNAYQGEHNETLAPFQVRRGDLLVHFAGVINRDERILFWLDRAEQHLPDWEIEVQHTSYPAEIRDFWIQKANERKSNQAETIETRKKAAEVLAQTDLNLAEYQDRLTPSDVTGIQEQQAALRSVLAVDDSDLDVASVNLRMTLLNQGLTPLNEAVASAHRILMKEAHDAIFAAEKEITGQTEASTPEVAEVEKKATSLKNLVVQPDWEKSDLSKSIESLKQASAKLQQKIQEQELQSGKLAEAEAKANEERKIAEAKADEERKKQAAHKAKFGES